MTMASFFPRLNTHRVLSKHLPVRTYCTDLNDTGIITGLTTPTTGAIATMIHLHTTFAVNFTGEMTSHFS